MKTFYISALIGLKFGTEPADIIKKLVGRYFAHLKKKFLIMCLSLEGLSQIACLLFRFDLSFLLTDFFLMNFPMLIISLAIN